MGNTGVKQHDAKYAAASADPHALPSSKIKHE